MKRPSPSLDGTIFEAFTLIDDPRSENAAHPMQTVLFCVIVAVLCGADGFVQAEEFANLRKDFIKKWVPLWRNKVPTHDTMARLFGSISPDQFVMAFATFMEGLTGRPRQDIINVDGKTLRGVVGASGRKGAAHVEDQAHIVAAFSTLRVLVLGQVRSSNVANEVVAARQLLQFIDIEGSVVTMDAAHTNEATLQLVNDRRGDFVVTVKGNVPELKAAIESAFTDAAVTTIVTEEHTHGGIETRTYDVLPATAQVKAAWPMIQSIMCVTRNNVSHSGKKQRSTPDTLYASSLPPNRAALFAKAVRDRWGIENKVNYVLDVTFNEDRSRIRVKHAPENFSRVRHIALSLLATMKTTRKLSMPLKRANAAVDDAFLARALRLPAR
jgi:predicted transposase YbfD/YdcC